jgi:2-polyprenyl-6-methoxyphenol hydroxylase-like FAD-dependent oxidoreductase
LSGFLGRRAVVLGAGIGGLAMAGALAKYFERVEILERDSLFPSAASPFLEASRSLITPTVYKRAALRPAA